MEAWSTQEAPSLDAAWHFPIGRLRQAQGESWSGEVLAAAVACALHFMVHGGAGNWRVRLPEPRRMLCGRWVLPLAGSIAAESDGSTVALHIECEDHSRQLQFSRKAQRWNEPVTELPQFGAADRQIVLLPPSLVGPEHFTQARPVMIEPAENLVQGCRNALDLLEGSSPAYLPWVVRLIRHIVLLQAQNKVQQSCSAEELPGFCCISFDENPLEIGELLVHEASHQHLNLLGLLGPFADAADPRRYYSPLKRTERPLERILVAYHAAGNSILYYRDCFESGRPQCGGIIETLKKQLRTLDAALRDNPALTDLGRAVYQPLAERLAPLL
jgi:HEXXH motif-containing protein